MVNKTSVERLTGLLIQVQVRLGDLTRDYTKKLGNKYFISARNLQQGETVYYLQKWFQESPPPRVVLLQRFEIDIQFIRK